MVSDRTLILLRALDVLLEPLTSSSDLPDGSATLNMLNERGYYGDGRPSEIYPKELREFLSDGIYSHQK